MTTFQGADTTQLREQDRTVTTGASALDDAVGSALDAVMRVSWIGPDADAFRSRCDGVRHQLDRALDDLRRRASELADHAEQQDSASDSGTGASGSPLGPLGDLIGDLFSGDAYSFHPGDAFGPIGPLPLGPMRDLLGGLVPGGGSSFDPSDAFGPLVMPDGPVRDVVEERFFSEDRYDAIDRVINWGQEAGGTAWEWSMDRANEVKDSKLFGVGRKVVPIIPDIFEISHAIGEGDADAVYAKSVRAMIETPTPVAVGDLLLGEVTGQLGDEHTVFGSDIRWNEGTPLDGLEEYMTQKSNESRIMAPGELYGQRWADEIGLGNGTTRNVMSSLGGVGTYGLMSSTPVLAIEHGTGFDIQQKIWDGMNSPFN